MPEGLTSIGERAFRECPSLVEVQLPSTLNEVGDYAFAYTALEKIAFPEGMTQLGENLFYDCNKIKEIVLPSTLKKIPYRAFYSCDLLTTINLPEGLTSIGDRAFRECYSLTEIQLPSTLESIGERAFRQSGLKKIEIPEGVKAISDEAFEGCESLEEVVLPPTIEKIGESAFESCTALASIAIPANTDSIHSDAFGMCTGLASISCDAVEPPVLGDDVFYEVSRDIKLRVPAEAIEAYRNAAVWNEFNIDMSVSINQPTVGAGITVVNGELRNPAGVAIKVYDAAGTLIYSGNAGSLSLPRGIYIVRTGRQSQKVAF